jgi:broad specificity phosphatase PhoE
MSTKIIIERHGQSLGNALGIYLGHTDLGLTEEGIMQATVTAEHLRMKKLMRFIQATLYVRATRHIRTQKCAVFQ